MGALDLLHLLDHCADQDVRLTFSPSLTDDTESMVNAARLCHHAGGRVDYVVQNPAKARGDLLRGSD